MEEIHYNEEEQLGKSYDWKLMKRLLGFAKPYWKFFAVAVLLLVLSSAADLARPMFIKIAIDDYINGYTKPMIAYPALSNQEGIRFEDKIYQRVDVVPQNIPTKDVYSIVYVDKDPYLVQGLADNTEAGTVKRISGTVGIEYTVGGEAFPARALSKEEIGTFRAGDIKSLGVIGLLFIGAILLGFVLNFLQIYLLSYAGQSIIFSIRQKVFSHIQKLPTQFFDNNPLGRLVTRVTNDAETLNEMYTNVLITFLKDIIIILGSIVIMVRLDLKLSMVTLSILPLVVITTVFFRIKARKIYRRVRTTLARINSALSENISGMRVIQIFHKEKENYKQFSKINHDYYRAVLSEVVVLGIFRPVIEMMAFTSIALIIWYGGGNVLQGTLQFGVLYAFVNYTTDLFHPINDLAEKFNILQSSMASSERIFMVLDTPQEVDQGTVEVDKRHFEGDIEFKNVWFAYNEGEWVLKDVSFKVPSGSTIAIVGATGAGKTSIINLLNRLYDIQKGDILINGINIKEMSKESLRKNIGMVLQDVFLFSGTISENIRLSEEEISEEDIQRVSKYVNADHFICRMDGGYDAEVKERGATFSSGQRQLLAFARALAFDPSVLILDEATANIDTETELLIQDALSKITSNRTTIVIAHRLSTIQHADNILVLHKGRIREMGKHQELLSKKGMYYNLYNLQYKGAVNEG